MVGYQSTETSAVHTKTENQANGDAKAPTATERVLKGLGHLGPGPLLRFLPLAGLATQALSSRKQSGDWHREIFIFLDSTVVAFKLVDTHFFLRHPSGSKLLRECS